MVRMSFILGLGLIAALAAAPTYAQEAAGSWRCKAADNIPIATINIDASGNYEVIVAANTVWDRKEGDPGNGTGTLTFEGDNLIPTSGPLLTNFEVTGVYSAENGRTIGWAFGGSYISLMHCWPADEIG